MNTEDYFQEIEKLSTLFNEYVDQLRQDYAHVRKEDAAVSKASFQEYVQEVIKELNRVEASNAQRHREYLEHNTRTQLTIAAATLMSSDMYRHDLYGACSAVKAIYSQLENV